MRYLFFAMLLAALATSPPASARERTHDEIAKMTLLDHDATAPTAFPTAHRALIAFEAIDVGGETIALPDAKEAASLGVSIAFDAGLRAGSRGVIERMNRVGQRGREHRVDHSLPSAYAERCIEHRGFLDRDIQRRSA